MTATVSHLSVLSTKEYEKFKKHPLNRDIEASPLKNLINSIKKNNELKYYPIIVDEQMQVVDGQHRLEAAKELDLPIFYAIKKGATPADIIAPNTASSPWKLEPFIRIYKGMGNENYAKLEDFMKKYQHNIKESLLLLKGHLGSQERQEFKEGKFEFPDERGLARSLELRGYITDVKTFLYEKLMSNSTRHIVKNLNIQYALFEFFSSKSVDPEIFMKKLELKLNWIRPCTTRTEYGMLFKQIYNFNNREPIE